MEDYVPPRWTRQTRWGNSASAWTVARPGRLLAFWAGLTVAAAVGIVCVVLAFLTAGWLVIFGPALVVPAALGLTADARYIPRTWRAWRAVPR